MTVAFASTARAPGEPDAPSLWLGREPLLLASTSPARLALLRAAGIPVEAEGAAIDERALEAALGPEASPATVAARLADAKAEAVSRRQPGRVVVGADQVVDLEGRPLGKAADRAAAATALASLSGRVHHLRTAAAVARDGAVACRVAASARMTMRPLGPEAIRLYLDRAGAASTRSAGGYEVEGLGIHLFDAIEGEHSTILGLPMLPLLAALRGLGLLAF